jgi:integrase
MISVVNIRAGKQNPGENKMWHQLIDGWDDYQTAIGRPRTTRDLRRYQISYLAKSLNIEPGRVTETDLIGWFAIHDWAPETRRSYRSAVQAFFAWAVKHKHIPNDPAVEIPQIKVPPASPRPAAEIAYREALMRADRRTTLMLRLAAEAGLRRAEVAQVHTRDLRGEPSQRQLLVHGKGGKQRLIPITDELAAMIGAGPAGHTVGGASTGWLFPSDKGCGHVNPPTVGEVCSKALGPGTTMHQLRHRFASKAYRGTRNLRAVQELLGHANVAVTERYTAVDDDERRAAMMSVVA